MSQPILDHFPPDENIDVRLYQRRSARHLKRSSFCILIAILGSMIMNLRGEFIPWVEIVIGLFALGSFGFSLVGVLMGVTSYVKKEPHALNRVLVLIGNLLIFGFFTSTIVANILDITRLLNN